MYRTHLNKLMINQLLPKLLAVTVVINGYWISKVLLFLEFNLLNDSGYIN